MGPIFELNEKLKEELVLNYQAKLAKTVFHEKGTILVEEPFLETEIIWNTDDLYYKVGAEKMKNIGKLIKDAKLEISNLGGYMTDPAIEWNKGFPVLVWAQFFKPQTENEKNF